MRAQRERFLKKDSEDFEAEVQFQCGLLNVSHEQLRDLGYTKVIIDGRSFLKSPRSFLNRHG